MENQLQGILSQRFRFLGEGLQSWVWEGVDTPHVLKFFKNMEEGKEQYRKWGKDPGELQQSWFDNGIGSCTLAFERLREETALVYIHVTDAAAPVEAFRLGEGERKDSRCHFLLQEKVELVRDRIQALMANGDIDGSKRTIDDVLELIATIWKKDVTEDTFNFDHNYGYTARGRLAQIDVGSFWQGKEHVRAQLAKKKLVSSASAQWIQERFPALREHYEQAVAALYKDFDRF